MCDCFNPGVFCSSRCNLHLFAKSGHSDVEHPSDSSCLQDFLLFAPQRCTVAVPIANYTFDPDEPGEWSHVSTERCLPVEIGYKMVSQGLGAVMRIVPSAEEDLLRSALRVKVKLSMDQLKTIVVNLGLPVSGTGAGKTPRVLKADYARALVEFLFTDETEDFRSDLVQFYSPPPRKKPTEQDSKESEVIKLISMLDPENASAFQKIAQYAKEKLDETGKEAGKREGIADLQNALQKSGISVDVHHEPGQPVRVERVHVKRKTDDKSELGHAPEVSIEAPEVLREDAEIPEAERAERSGPAHPKRSRVTPREFKDLFPPDAVGKMMYFHDPDQQVFKVQYPGSLAEKEWRFQ